MEQSRLESQSRGCDKTPILTVRLLGSRSNASSDHAPSDTAQHHGGPTFARCLKLVGKRLQTGSQHLLCVCVIIPSILDVRLVDEPAGVTQEEGHTGFLHLPSAVLALIFLARRIQPFLSLDNREVEFCVLTN